MLFILPAIAVLAETAATVTATALATAGPLGTAIASGTAAVSALASAPVISATTKLGVDAVSSALLSQIAVDGTTTALNCGVMEACSELISDI